MNEFVCLARYKNKQGKIVGYRLQLNNGNVFDVSTDVLKSVLLSGLVICNNLKLTKNNKIIVYGSGSVKTVEIKSIKNKARVQTLYRFILYDEYNKKELGGLYRGIKSALDIMESYGSDEDVYYDYEYVDRMLGELEYSLPYPNINNKKVRFYYKSNYYYLIRSKIKEIDDVLRNYKISIQCKRKLMRIKNVVYEDNFQVAMV